MSTLNEEQIKAVEHFYGPCLVSACPGAGKTRVIAFRAIHLIKKGVLPDKILLVTFTNKAAREMRERITKLSFENSILSDSMAINTFHTMCLNIVKRSKFTSLNYKKVNILDNDDVESILKSVAEEYDSKAKSQEIDIKHFMYLYSSLREKALKLDQIEEELYKIEPIYVEIKRSFDQCMKNINAVDFSGIMYNFWCEINSNENFREEVQKMFDFIMIDEVQDTNIIQFQIAKIIAEKHNNVFMVGDTDQSIYQWRGANPSQVSEFVKSSECKVYKLSKNYRCTGSITRLASSLISFNSNRLNSEIVAHRDSGEPVNMSVFCTRQDESDQIAKSILRLNKFYSVKFKDISILVRASHLTRSIEQSLMMKNIPYSITGGFRFYDREEIKDIISMLKFVHNPKDAISFCRFMNKPRRGLGNKCVNAISASTTRGNVANNLEEYLNKTDEINDASKKVILKLIQNIFSKPVSGMSLKEVITHVVEATNYNSYLNTFKGETSQDKLDNVLELIKSADSSNQSLSDFLTSVCLMTTPKEAQEEDVHNSVKIMTMHAAKGLEFSNVFIPCMEENILPHRRSLQENNGLEEERRLAYVAMTRAMDRLYISTSLIDSYSDKAIKMPSRFIFESGLCDKETYYELAQEAKNSRMA